MSRYQYELATLAHDAELRSILAATPTDGHIRVSFRREPSFFGAAVVDGRYRQILVCRDRASNRLAGFGSRSITMRYVNGRPTPIGYLSNLRGRPEYRNRGLLARGYAYLRQLHADGKTRLYLTTIAAGNHQALAILPSGRADLPAYHYAGTFHTVAIPLPRRGSRKTERGSPIRVRQATPEDLEQVVAFLHSTGPARQFFPHYAAADFCNPLGPLRNLPLASLLLAFCGERLVGTLGGWDQSAFRQTVVEGYSAALQWTRPLYNAWTRLRGRSPLPRPGEPLRYLLAALPVVLDSDLQVFACLLRRLMAQGTAAHQDFVLIGLHEADPLLPVARAHGAHTYQTRLYLVCWEDGEALYQSLDGRSPYLELGCL